MRRLAVVSYPELAAADRQWIESLRSEHDPLARKINAHITLVFPFQTAAATMSNEIALVATEQVRFGFTAGAIEAVRDAFGPGGHVFLVLGDGRDAIVKIHDQLYAGRLRPHLREDIPFIPHITLASHGDFARCPELAARVGRELREIRGFITSLELIDVDCEPVQPIEHFDFGSGASNRRPVHMR